MYQLRCVRTGMSECRYLCGGRPMGVERGNERTYLERLLLHRSGKVHRVCRPLRSGTVCGGMPCRLLRPGSESRGERGIIVRTGKDSSPGSSICGSFCSDVPLPKVTRFLCLVKVGAPLHLLVANGNRPSFVLVRDLLPEHIPIPKSDSLFHEDRQVRHPGC